MALDACVACLNIVHACRIQDIYTGWVRDVLAARSVALLTSNIPFCHLLRVDVVVHRVTTVTSGTCRTLHIVGRIKRLPPIGSFGDEVRTPDMIGDVPLRWFWKVVVADSSKIPLLPNASINKCHL